MLSAADDLLIHQVAEPVRFVQTSDRNFYDRYYFFIHNSSDELAMVVGLGLYPNLGTLDAFATLRLGDRHHVIRSSRELGDRMDTGSGPLRIEVLEGLKRLRIRIDPNDSAIEADLTFEATHPPQQEPRQAMRSRGRMVMDVMRFGQSGSYTGTLRLPDGRTLEASAPRWQGYRDRSWGVRPVGEPEPAGITAKSNPSYFWLYCSAQFDDHTLMLKLQDLGNGKRVLEEAVRVWNDPDRRPEHLHSVKHTMTLDDNKLYFTGGVITARERDGSELRVEIEQLIPVYLGAGTGYWDEDPDWRHGRYQGKLKTESLVFDITDKGVGVPSVIDALGRYRCNGKVGHGLFEYGLMGSLPQFSLEGEGYWNGPGRR